MVDPKLDEASEAVITSSIESEIPQTQTLQRDMVWDEIRRFASESRKSKTGAAVRMAPSLRSQLGKFLYFFQINIYIWDSDSSQLLVVIHGVPTLISSSP